MREVVGQERLGRAMGFTSMALSMALLLGPVLGGVLYEYAGYFQTFCPALALLGVELVLRLLIIEDRTRDVVGSGEDKRPEEGEGRNRAKDDDDIDRNTEREGFIGATSESTGTTTTIETSPHALESQPLLPTPPSPPPPPAPQSPTANHRNVYLILLTSPRFLTSLIGLFILSSTAYSFDAVLAPYINSTFSLGPAHVAILFIALAIPMLFSPLTGLLTDRFGPKIVAATGLAIEVPSLAALSLVRSGVERPMLCLGALFFLIGVAYALSTVPLRVDASAAVGALEEERPGAFGPRGAYARAFGLLNGVVAAGGMVGPLAAGWVRILIGWEGMAVTMGGSALLVLGLVVVLTGGRKS